MYILMFELYTVYEKGSWKSNLDYKNPLCCIWPSFFVCYFQTGVSSEKKERLELSSSDEDNPSKVGVSYKSRKTGVSCVFMFNAVSIVWKFCKSKQIY